MKGKFEKPTLDALRGYARAIHYTDFDADAFFDYYESVGWTVGKSRKPMVCWQAAIRTWRRNQTTWAADAGGAQSNNRASAAKAESRRRSDWEAALRDLVLAVWPHHADRAEVGRMLRAARDKYRDLGCDKAGRTVGDAALEVIRAREENGWGGR